ncbi:MAG: helix-turn-helix domain-containing protein [Acetatifactor sp.]|nr:helix-turn-helix domain-containing protein [Acetatifactor sp.]
MNFGKTLQNLRTERGIFQKELAAALHLSVGTVSNYEEGVSSPDLEMLCRIADYFQVSTDYLLGRTQ